jgi:hypothetical protein
MIGVVIRERMLLQQILLDEKKKADPIRKKDKDSNQLELIQKGGILLLKDYERREIPRLLRREVRDLTDWVNHGMIWNCPLKKVRTLPKTLEKVIREMVD